MLGDEFAGCGTYQQVKANLRKETPMGTTEGSTLTSHVRAERQRLAELFAGFTDEQWDSDSLCARWRVRDVAAHLTMPYRTRRLAVLAGVLRAGLRFNRFAEVEAREAADARSGADLAELLRSNVDNPWTPPGGGPAGALSHDVIHGLDITEALGLPAAPAERIAMVLDASGPGELKYFGVDLTGRRLVASDADFGVGDGRREEVMTAKEVLLTITGRRK